MYVCITSFTACLHLLGSNILSIWSQNLKKKKKCCSAISCCSELKSDDLRCSRSVLLEADLIAFVLFVLFMGYLTQLQCFCENMVQSETLMSCSWPCIANGFTVYALMFKEALKWIWAVKTTLQREQIQTTTKGGCWDVAANGVSVISRINRDSLNRCEWPNHWNQPMRSQF